MSDLLMIGARWGQAASITQCLLPHLAVGRRVLYVGAFPGTRRRRRIIGGLAPQTVVGPPPSGVTVLTPAIRLAGSRGPIGDLASRMTRRAISDAMERIGMTRPIIWTAEPVALDLIDAIDHRALIYYCGDDPQAREVANDRPILPAEQYLAASADLILAATPRLAARFPAEKTALLPGGTDLSAFFTPARRAADLPVDRPTAGCIGPLDAPGDIELLKAIARHLPDWRFICLNTAPQTDAAFRGCDNVLILGPRDRDALPRYVQHWDVSMLLGRGAGAAPNSAALLRDYLAGGRPVVTMASSFVEDYRSVVTMVGSPHGFTTALRAARLEPEDRIRRRRDRAAVETWQARAAEAAAVIDGVSQ